MAVRAWTDDGSELRVPTITETATLSGIDQTFAAIVKPSAKAAFEACISGYDVSLGHTTFSFGMSSSNKPFYLIRTAGGSTITQQPDTGGVLTNGQYYIIVYTAAPVRTFHIYDFNTATWTHMGNDLGPSTLDDSTQDYIAFGHDTEYSFDLNARYPLAAVWNQGLSELQIEALAANLETADWINHAVPPIGVWSFTQANASDDVFDVMGNHDTITGSITGDSDTVGRTGTTIVVGEDPPGWDLTIPPPVMSFEIRYSGGSTNENANLSIGGAMSTITAEDVFDSVSSTQALVGVTDYRLVYVLNTDVADGILTAYVSSQLTGTGLEIAIGPASESAGNTVTAIENDTTSPGVTFAAPTTEEEAVDCGIITPGDMKGVWLRRTVPESTAEDPTNPWSVTFTLDPA